MNKEAFVGKKTPFYALHVSANAKIVDFAGWDMPIQYTSIIEEHQAVRTGIHQSSGHVRQHVRSADQA